ncbi:Num1 protein [Maudiozyma humilis]|uniref:Num1 protein n=1 Tax=Maudiozyma humilis TaxID=51915 RepID=A0AAV5RVZ0_MAUHU|nr:Num1 protein [Kazachstania humilis]
MPYDALVSTLLHGPLMHSGASPAEVSALIGRGSGRLSPSPVASASASSSASPRSSVDADTDADLLSLLNASLAEQCARLTAENDACRGRNATLAAELRSRSQALGPAVLAPPPPLARTGSRSSGATPPGSPRKKRHGAHGSLAHRLLAKALPLEDAETTVEETDVSSVTMPREEYARLVASVSDPPVALLREEAAEKGFRLVSAQEWAALQPNAHPPLLQLIQEAKKQGYTVVSDADYGAMWALSSAEPEQRARADAQQCGLAVLPQTELDAMSAAIADPPMLYLIQHAKRHGHTVVSDADYEGLMEGAGRADAAAAEVQSLREQLENPPHTYLYAQASACGQILLPLEQYDEMRSAAEANAEAPPPALQEQRAYDEALPPADYVRERLQETPENSGEEDSTPLAVPRTRLAAIAAELAHAAELEAEQFDVTQEEPQDAVEEARAAARRVGMLCVPEDAFVATAGAADNADNASVVVLPRSYYSTLLQDSHPALASAKDEELLREVKRRGMGNAALDTFTLFSGDNGTKRTSTHSSTHTSRGSTPLPGSLSDRNYVAQTASEKHTPAPRSLRTAPSMDGALSLASVSGASVSGNVSAAIAHTVAGEYAYKAYPRLGAFGGGETAHRRFFWVDPRARTLYWAEDKPAGSATGARTKSAAIVTVRSVANAGHGDAALYSKSIVVATRDKEIKFTCASRQRHNMWMNALRYILKHDVVEDAQGEVYGAARDAPVVSVGGGSASVVSRRSSISRFLR